MKILFINTMILSFRLLAHAESITQSYCKDTSLKTAKGIFRSQGESVSSVDIVKESSIALSGEDYSEESFDLRLKKKKSEACVTLKYYGNKKSCALISYQYPGCH